jgi:hypothetical protein
VSRDVLDLIDGAISACDYAAMPDAMRWTTEPERASALSAPTPEQQAFQLWIVETADAMDSAMATVGRVLADAYATFAGAFEALVESPDVQAYLDALPSVRRRRVRLSRMRRLYRARR